MATSILSRTIGVEDRRIVLNNSEGVRRIGIGNNWVYIKVGVRLAFDASATISGSPVLAVGLCSMDESAGWGFGEASTPHFIGFRISGSDMTYNAGPPAYLQLGATSYHQACKRVNGVTTDFGNILGNLLCFSSAPATNRSCLFFHAVKGSPNFSFTLSAPITAAGAQADISLAQFQAGMDMVGSSSMSSWQSGYNDAWSGYKVGAVSEATDGDLNAVNIYWNKTVPLEISDIAVTRMS